MLQTFISVDFDCSESMLSQMSNKTDLEWMCVELTLKFLRFRDMSLGFHHLYNLSREYFNRLHSDLRQLHKCLELFKVRRVF